jgi:hypothetical protein
MAQPGPPDYRTSEDFGRSDQSTANSIGKTSRNVGEQAADMASQLADAVRNRPYTTLAIAAGLAFAVGALWKLRDQQPRSSLKAWLAQLPDLPSRDSLMRR